jgi:hypothetical protein
VFLNNYAAGSSFYDNVVVSASQRLTPGTVVTGTLNPGNATNIYQFDGTAGDRFYFDRLSQGSGTVYWRLIDPFGQQVWWNGFGSVPTQALPSTGTYTLLVEGYTSNTSPVSYSFNAQKVTNTTAALTVGTTVNSAITQAGQQNFYTFTLASASQLYFDSLTNDGSLSWTLTGPRGTEINSRSFTGSEGASVSNPVLNLIAGNYTLSVAGSGDHTASYSFGLLNLASATPLTFGNPISGTLPSGNNTVMYQFTAAAGDQVALNQQALDSSLTPYWRVIDPYGGVTYGASFGNSGTLTLPVAGTYTLLLEGQIGANGALDCTLNVSFQNHVTIAPPTGTALTLGALTSGAISTAGQQNNYVFTITNPTNVYFDSQTNNGSLIWSLIGPTATLVNQCNFTARIRGTSARTRSSA